MYASGLDDSDWAHALKRSFPRDILGRCCIREMEAEVGIEPAYTDLQSAA